MPELVLYVQPGFQVPGRARCFSGTPFAIKVERVLRWKRLPFRVREVSFGERDELLPRLGSSGKLPVLEYDGRCVEDSTEIALFVEERHPDPPLLPADPAARARCHFLEEWADEVLYWYGMYEQRRIADPRVVFRAYLPDLPESALDAVVEREGARVDANLDRQGIGRYPPEKVKGDVLRGLGALEALVRADGYLAGPDLSLADLAVFGQVNRRLAGTNPWLEEQWARRAALVGWYHRVDGATAR